MNKARQAGERIAVIGGGISGLAAAWLLARRYDVTLYEAGDYVGGHSNTIDVTLGGTTHPVDTGFLVHNERTYPNLIALFAELGVQTVASDMSFAVALPHLNLEWAGSNLNTVFGQRRNLLRPAFWRMLSDILRFNRNAAALLAESRDNGQTLLRLLDRGGYGQEMREWYLLPMAAAIWSSPSAEILRFPAATFLQFCLNHGLLQVNDRPQWKTVAGGSREYVARMLPAIQQVRVASPVSAVRRFEDHVEIDSLGQTAHFDQVVFATHAPDTLALLSDASAAEAELLSAIRYQPNRAVVHTDASFLPSRRGLWSAWNYQGGPAGEDLQRPVCVSYLINALQPLPFAEPVIVTLNPWREPDPATVIRDLDYDHPLFDELAIRAQEGLWRIQGNRRSWFCGAWCGYGFHEDGLKAGMRVANALGVRAAWQGDGDV
ncbi:NAD(P)/FAD-dependent oxidoreductase [Chitinilyticum litopenaei]|uniref:NAD(P)/FAD-dependent oxidoreductase n=1 Tax=Chitinilyticum litopenaei TaxID=1121276 RepID=UPI00040CF002|nr:FAD-dependent oxidoreductase [Chitinilyticum litopenaei]